MSVDHPLIDDYLTRLDAAAAALPPARRVELVADLRSHIAEALAADPRAATSGPAAELAVREALDRLGAPEDIVADEAGPTSGPAPTPPPSWTAPGPMGAPGPSRWGALELAAVIGLIAGGFIIPVVGTLIGLVCAWLSPRWTTTEKIVATLWASSSMLGVLLAGAIVGLNLPFPRL